MRAKAPFLRYLILRNNSFSFHYRQNGPRYVTFVLHMARIDSEGSPDFCILHPVVRSELQNRPNGGLQISHCRLSRLICLIDFILHN